MEHTWLSLLPFLIVIGMSIWLKDILPGLVVGLLVGSIIVTSDVLEGTGQSVSYMVTTLSDESNIKIISFLYLFGGLIGMMNISGGIKGFSEWIGSKIKQERGVLGLIWLTLPFTFMMPMFRIMMIGPIVKTLIKKMRLSKDKVGMIMDISTESVIVLLPVATAFVGFMVSLVEGSTSGISLEQSSYEIFLLSILFNFFAIVMLVMGVLQTFWPASKKKNSSHQTENHQLEEEEHEFHRVGIKKELSMVKAQPWHLIVPVFLLLGLSLYLLWKNGTSLGAQTVFEAFSMADATFVMLLAVFITLIATFIFYILRRQALNELLYHFYDGGNQMMQAISLLILIWALALSAEDLGFSDFISSTLGGFLPAYLTPATVFLIGSVVGYFIGSSWGTWGLFMPLGVALAVSTDASIPLTVGAVFASGAFGALTSPLGDTTITTASILDLDLVDYARYKLKFASIGGIISILFYVAAALFIV